MSSSDDLESNDGDLPMNENGDMESEESEKEIQVFETTLIVLFCLNFS